MNEYNHIVEKIQPTLKKYKINTFKIYPDKLKGINDKNNNYNFVYSTHNEKLSTLDGLIQFENELVKALNYEINLIDQYTLDYSIRPSTKKLKELIKANSIIIYKGE